MRPQYDELVRQCDRWLKSPPPTAEPPKYPEDVVRGSEEWRKIWWGNRTYTINALDGAATLAFTRLLGGKGGVRRPGQADPDGLRQMGPERGHRLSLQRRSRDAVQLLFPRTYTFVNDLLSEERA